ncbi:MAG: hypothetical protein WC052_00025 [Patescibacteria group bacterium]|jgi:hypothetical protein
MPLAFYHRAVVALVFLGFLAAPAALAVNEACLWPEEYKPKIGDILNRVACDAGLLASYQNDAPTEDAIIIIVGNVINVILGFAGVIFTILIIYAGYLWMTARGNEEQAQQAQQYIRNAVIGIIITFAAFTITQYALFQVTNAVTSGAIGF